MPTINIITREGDRVSAAGDDGSSLMEAIREAGIDELLAICGGCLSCATCHVYVDEADFARLLPMSEDEDDLLGGTEARTGTSRLSCQVVLDDTLDGMTVTIAPD